MVFFTAIAVPDLTSFPSKAFSPNDSPVYISKGFFSGISSLTLPDLMMYRQLASSPVSKMIYPSENFRRSVLKAIEFFSLLVRNWNKETRSINCLES